MDNEKAAHKDNAKRIAAQLGKNIERLRAGRGLSQESLAKAAGLDRSYMGRIERGQVNLTLPKVYRLADVLGCRLAELLP